LGSFISKGFVEGDAFVDILDANFACAWVVDPHVASSPGSHAGAIKINDYDVTESV